MIGKPLEIYLHLAALWLTLLVLAWVLWRCWRPRRWLTKTLWAVAAIGLALLSWPVAVRVTMHPPKALALRWLLCLLLALTPRAITLWRERGRGRAHASGSTPSFAWLAGLILLPTFALAAFGFLAIQRDRAAVELEARQRARELAQGMADGFAGRVAQQLDSAASQSLTMGWPRWWAGAMRSFDRPGRGRGRLPRQAVQHGGAARARAGVAAADQAAGSVAHEAEARRRGD